MPVKGRYELGLNWCREGDDPFLEEIARAARLRRIHWLVVPRAKTERIRRRVDRRQVEVGLFLNTQADGVNMESPAMLLCQSLKASGCLVVEDPDDAPVYADRALQMRYLERAGLAVPPFAVVEGWEDGTTVPERVRARLAPRWVAKPAVGMRRNRVLESSARQIAKALSNAGFRPHEKVVVQRHVKPATLGNRELHFSVWYFYGHIVPCCRTRGARVPELMKAAESEMAIVSQVSTVISRIAEITGLDWFMTELIVPKSKPELQLVAVEPANALAGFGPGVKAQSHLPAAVVRIAAERIVEVSWRHSCGLVLSNEKTLRLAP